MAGASAVGGMIRISPESVNVERGGPAFAGSATGSAGPIRQNPCSSVPSSPAKTAGESNLGRQSQSTAPSLLTRAAVCMSPMSA